MAIDEITLIEDVAFRVDESALAQRLRVGGRPRFERDLRAIIREAEAIARPKALYRAATVRRLDNGRVLVGDALFSSAKLHEALGQVTTAFPFLATCGVEIAVWAASSRKLLHAYWMDILMQAALDSVLVALKSRIREKLGPNMSSIRPGIPRDWPITEQRPFFSLFGGAEASIGLRLTPECLMEPSKSVSGLWFASKRVDKGCALCGLDHCREREPDCAGREGGSGE